MDSEQVIWLVIAILIIICVVGFIKSRKAAQNDSYNPEEYLDPESTTDSPDINIKDSSTESTYSITSERIKSSSTGRSSYSSSVKQEAEPLSGPPQKTLYFFKTGNSKSVCPFCDGENSKGTKVCNICRREL